MTIEHTSSQDDAAQGEQSEFDLLAPEIDTTTPTSAVAEPPPARRDDQRLAMLTPTAVANTPPPIVVAPVQVAPVVLVAPPAPVALTSTEATPVATALPAPSEQVLPVAVTELQTPTNDLLLVELLATTPRAAEPAPTLVAAPAPALGPPARLQPVPAVVRTAPVVQPVVPVRRSWLSEIVFDLPDPDGEYLPRYEEMAPVSPSRPAETVPLPTASTPVARPTRRRARIYAQPGVALPSTAPQLLDPAAVPPSQATDTIATAQPVLMVAERADGRPSSLQSADVAATQPVLMVAAPRSVVAPRRARIYTQPSAAASHERVVAPIAALPDERTWWLALIGAVTAIAALVMRSVNLDNLPGEMYGDINILYEYVQQIFRGDWPTGFFLSAGPLYQYLIIPILSVVGTNFLGFKIASVITSLGVVAMTYLFVRELANRHLAVLSAFITGVSSWLLVYSRLGNLQVFVPLLVVTALFFAVRTVRHNRWGDAVAGGVVAGLGLYVYPPSFILAPVILVALVLVRWTGTGIKYRSIALFAAAAAVTGALFVRIVAKDPGNFFSGYIGGKIQSDQSTAQVLWQNVQRSVGAFHVRGDVSFRGNPPLLPHLDVLSGILMVVGLGWWIVGPRRRWSPLLIVPFVLIQVPAMLVLSAPQDVPSVSRTLGIAPLAYIFAATGLWWLVGLLRRIPWLPRLITAAALTAILLLNTQRYFTLYAQNLPHRNTPFAKIVTRYLDALPADTHPYIAYCDGAPDDPTRVIGCGWGQASQPEPKSIQFDGQGVARTITELQPKDVTCEGLRALPKPAIILWRPDAPVPSAAISACSELLKPELHTAPNGVQVFNSSFIAP